MYAYSLLYGIPWIYLAIWFRTRTQPMQTFETTLRTRVLNKQRLAIKAQTLLAQNQNVPFIHISCFCKAICLWNCSCACIPRLPRELWVVQEIHSASNPRNYTVTCTHPKSQTFTQMFLITLYLHMNFVHIAQQFLNRSREVTNRSRMSGWHQPFSWWQSLRGDLEED